MHQIYMYISVHNIIFFFSVKHDIKDASPCSDRDYSGDSDETGSPVPGNSKIASKSVLEYQFNSFLHLEGVDKDMLNIPRLLFQ